MAFSFGFGGDDIDESLQDGEREAEMASVQIESASTQHSHVEVKRHDLIDLLSNLPSRISYATTTITSPTGKVLHLPRRELFDVRAQLMAEDDDATLASLSSSDLTTNVYEGGFKTWECSIDLSSLLLDRGPRKDIDELARVDSVIELGAGTALPSLVLFQHALKNQYAVTFTLADFNAEVLRLVTLPNLLLTYARLCSGNSVLDDADDGSGDLDITPELKSDFLTALAAAQIQLNFISGPWSSALADIIPASSPDLGTVILAAETIYSPASTNAFVDLVVHILKRVKMAKAIVAAKRMYFGVGGSVDGLKEACRDKGAVAYEVENSGVAGMDQGVGRALLEVQLY